MEHNGLLTRDREIVHRLVQPYCGAVCGRVCVCVWCCPGMVCRGEVHSALAPLARCMMILRKGSTRCHCFDSEDDANGAMALRLPHIPRSLFQCGATDRFSVVRIKGFSDNHMCVVTQCRHSLLPQPPFMSLQARLPHMPDSSFHLARFLPHMPGRLFHAFTPFGIFRFPVKR